MIWHSRRKFLCKSVSNGAKGVKGAKAGEKGVKADFKVKKVVEKGTNLC